MILKIFEATKADAKKIPSIISALIPIAQKDIFSKMLIA
jgi:hypothetical protein